MDGTAHRADPVISAADGHFTVLEALGGRYLDQGIRDLYDGKVYRTFPSLIYVSLGVKRPFSEEEGGLTRILLREPWILCDGSEVRSLDAHVLSFDPTLAPEGGTVINAMIQTRAYDWWEDLRQVPAQGAAGAVELLHGRPVDVAGRLVTEVVEDRRRSLVRPSSIRRANQHCRPARPLLAPRAMLLPPPQVRRYTPRKTGSAHDVLHKVIREHLGELIAMTEERGRPLRPYVLHELAGYLACGRPEAGFGWYECPECKHALVLPF